jgi:hypothetical protein
MWICPRDTVWPFYELFGEATICPTGFLSGAGNTAPGDYFGDVTITCGTTVLHVPWWVRIAWSK